MAGLSNLSLPEIVAIVLAAVAGLIAGFVSGRRRRERTARETARMRDELARTDQQIREQSRIAAKLRSEQQFLKNLSISLPRLVRELNRESLDFQDIPRQLLDLAGSVFEPSQMLLFLVRSPGDTNPEGQELLLRDHRGLGEVPKTASRVRRGEGKIGWVAASMVEMADDDWLNLSRTEGRTLDDNHPAFRLSLIGPIVHHGKEDHLLGVLCSGEPATRPKNEKLVLQMITNLGAIAYRNVQNVRALQQQAHHDGLTGLYNKPRFMEQLGEMIFASERRAQPLAIFMFDIDFFKQYNDSNGHQAGDEALRGVAEVLRRNLRPQDLAGRYGGEEFIVAMPLADGEQALRVAERIREAIAAHRFPHRETQPGGALTISGGVSVFPQDGANSTDLIGCADRSLYRAKAAGKNRVFLHKTFEMGDDRGDFPDPEDLERRLDSILGRRA